MKGVIVTTENEVEIRDFDAPAYKSIGEAVGGYIEIVHPVGLEPPFVMIVNDEGLLRNLKPNPIGCVLYGTAVHGHPIVGNIVIVKEGWVSDELDILSLDQDETNTVLAIIKRIRDELKGANT